MYELCFTTRPLYSRIEARLQVKGNITQGPIVKIQVDQSNKVIDWNKASVKIFTTSVDSSLESNSLEKVLK
ncbi:hypothetical protein TrLO_g10717 [Triparma laevis f. longispina]|uniref:Uncharacterized protein n=1 Tax=Triparma laevis f. longispina TaxID=1714387 RepID=A0A9W7C653_9STRA|nr:hypothetical protein TrLO_g10717 [Triparma laevis f. longispina]